MNRYWDYYNIEWKGTSDENGMQTIAGLYAAEVHILFDLFVHSAGILRAGGEYFYQDNDMGKGKRGWLS